MTIVNRSEWEQGYTVAHIWYCGDEECDCIQPVIERVTPNRKGGYPWVHRDRLWEGTFTTGGYDGEGRPITYESLVEELREAHKAYPDAVWQVAE